jgi:hypothetical protein
MNKLDTLSSKLRHTDFERVVRESAITLRRKVNENPERYQQLSRFLVRKEAR